MKTLTLPESQKGLNKQIDAHKARQSEIAQGMQSSRLRKRRTPCDSIDADSSLAMEKERLEAVEAERAIAEFSRKKESLMEHRQNLLKQIDETRNAIQKKRERRTPHIAPDLYRTICRTKSHCSTGIKERARTIVLGRTFGDENRRRKGRCPTDRIQSHQ